MPGTMLIEQGNTLLLQIAAEHLTHLVAISDGVIAGWNNEGDIPEGAGRILLTEQGVSIWIGTKRDAYASDNDPRHILETPRVWLDTASARQWVDLANGDVDAAVEAINAQIVHDADVSAPDCDERDPGTGFTCTLAEDHDGATHVAGLGRACIAHVFAGAV